MMRFVETVWLVFFLAGLLLLGVFGTWTETPPFWYGAALISVAGIGALLSRQGYPAQTVAWKCLWVMAVFVCYIGWRGFTSEVRWLARQDLVFASTALVAYGLIATRFPGSRARLALLAVFFLLIAGNTGVGLYQYFEDPRWSVFRWFGLKRSAEVSAGGFFVNSNHMAGFMTLAGLPLLGVTVLGRGLSGMIRGGSAFGFLLAGTGVAFSTSRGGSAGFLVGMGILIAVGVIIWWGARRRPPGRSAIGMGWWLLCLGLAFVVLLAGAGFTIKKMFGTRENITSLNGRGPMWDAALEQWQVAPLLGTGARSYEYMERGFRTLDTTWMTWAGEIDALFAHNDYLQCLGDYGIIGLALALLVTGSHVWNAVRSVMPMAALKVKDNRPADALSAGLAIGAVAAIAGIMTQALVDFNLHIGINAVMTGILLGLMATPGFKFIPPDLHSKADNSPAPKIKAGAGVCGRRLAVGAVMGAVSLILLETGWRFAPADFAWRQGRKQLNTAVSLPDLIATSGTLQRATTLDPENGQAWYLRGMVTLEIASRTSDKYAAPFYEASLTQFERCLAVYPQYPYAASQAGKIAGYLGRMEVAEAHFKTALRWGLNIQSVNEMYGDYLIIRKDYKNAVGYLLTALHLSGNQDTRENLERKMRLCLKKLKQQGIVPPPEVFLLPGETLN